MTEEERAQNWRDGLWGLLVAVVAGIVIWQIWIRPWPLYLEAPVGIVAYTVGIGGLLVAAIAAIKNHR